MDRLALLRRQSSEQLLCELQTRIEQVLDALEVAVAQLERRHPQPGSCAVLHRSTTRRVDEATGRHRQQPRPRWSACVVEAVSPLEGYREHLRANVGGE